jgi:hypothetical protein
MRDVLDGIFILVFVVGCVYGRSKLWTIMFPNEDMVPWMGPKKIQKLFGDDPDKKE